MEIFYRSNNEKISTNRASDLVAEDYTKKFGKQNILHIANKKNF